MGHQLGGGDVKVRSRSSMSGGMKLLHRAEDIEEDTLSEIRRLLRIGHEKNCFTVGDLCDSSCNQEGNGDPVEGRNE